MFQEQDFSVIATGGLGHPGSPLAQAMVVFRGQLYIGSSAPAPTRMDDRARIFRLDPVTGESVCVFESPLVPLDAQSRPRASWVSSGWGGGRQRVDFDATEIGGEIGIRSMAVFQGKSDAAPCLYVGTMSIWGGVILRSEDGENFEPVTTPGMGDDRVFSFRGLTVFDGRLYALPSGTITDEGLNRNTPPRAQIWCSADPATGVWEPACLVGFGDPANVAVFSLAVWRDRLFAGTANAARGFQLWQSPDPDAPAFDWTMVMKDGAERFSNNFGTAAMLEFGGDLYIGTGIPGFGYDADNDVGPAAAELIRLHADGSWDLVMGEPRFSTTGLVMPLSALGPGFGNPFNAVLWSLCVHDGTLYAGTHNWEANDWVMGDAATPFAGGFELWASDNGTDWTRVLDGGMGDPGRCGLRCMVSLPQGLVLGTLNHGALIGLQARMRDIADRTGALGEGFDVIFADGKAMGGKRRRG